MKKIMFTVFLLGSLITSAIAQDDKDESSKGFKKENLFTGGSITASFYSGGTSGAILGVNPIFGYKLNDYVDAGVALNYTYSGAHDIYDTKIHQNVFGGGLFARVYPVKFLFLQGQFEHNYLKEKDTYADGFVDHFTGGANSLLAGAGIAEGRQKGSNTFFYVSILFDVLRRPNSPYVNNIVDGNGQVIRTDLVPILRAGVNVALFQGKKKKYDDGPRGDGHRHARNYNM